MFGVVLWSDEQEQKAVIWCEDHGDLAFYRKSTDACKFEMDAGDWVQFDMTLERHQRLAHNPQLVSEGVYPELADALCAVPLQEAGQTGCSDCSDPTKLDRKSAQIIPFLPTPPVSGKTKATGCTQVTSHASV